MLRKYSDQGQQDAQRDLCSKIEKIRKKKRIASNLLKTRSEQKEITSSLRVTKRIITISYINND
jgi:hypothetical protein